MIKCCVDVKRLLSAVFLKRHQKKSWNYKNRIDRWFNNVTYFWILVIQIEHGSREISDHKNSGKVSSDSYIFYRLHPYQLCYTVGGRFKNATHLDCFQKPYARPTTLLTNLIFLNVHTILLHVGLHMILADVRRRFWSINGRNMFRKVTY